MARELVSHDTCCQTRLPPRHTPLSARGCCACRRFGAVPEAYSPSPAVVELARRVLEAAPAASPPLYARVDGIVGDDDSESARFSLTGRRQTRLTRRVLRGRLYADGARAH